MKNNKGFTLIEIIGAIIILGILLIIAIPYMNRNLETFREDYYNSIEETILASGKNFYTDNRKYLPSSFLESSKVSINTLESQKYMDEILDYEGNSCNKDSYVIVIKKSKTAYDYYLCLICEGDNYDTTEKNECDSVWEKNDTLTIELGEPPVAYIYKDSTREEVKEKLKISADIVRYNNEGEEIARVNGEGEENIPEILPSNIDTIDTTKVGEYETIYEYEGAIKKGKAIVYENVGPYVKMTQVNMVRKGNATSSLQEERASYTGTGEWAQKLIIEFGEGDETGVKYGESGTNITKYQWKRGERWLDICTPSNGDSCIIEYTEEMNEVVYFRAVDNEGNISNTTKAYTIRIDNTAPKCELMLSGTMGNNNWYVSDTTISFKSAIDQIGDNANAISGIKSKGVTLGVIGTNATGVQNTDTSNVTWYGVVEDNAKNSTICSVNFKRDATKPECSLNLSGTLGNNNWYVGNVGVSFNKNTDNLSGVAQYGIGSLTGNKSMTHTQDTSSITYTGQIKDNAGNTNTCTVSFKKDATKPECSLTLSGTLGNNNWYVGNVGVSFNKNTDNLSGVAQYGIGSLTGNKSMTHTQDTSSITYTGQIKDNAGNTNTCTVSFKKDATKPTVSWTTNIAKDSDGSYHSNTGITVTGTCNDAMSGTSVKTTTNVSSPSNPKAVGITCTDNAGNSQYYSSNFYVKSYGQNSSCGWNSCLTGSNTCQGGYNRVWDSCKTTSKNCTYGYTYAGRCNGVTKKGSGSGYSSQNAAYNACDYKGSQACSRWDYTCTVNENCDTVCHGGYVNGSWNSCLTGSNTCQGGYNSCWHY